MRWLCLTALLAVAACATPAVDPDEGRPENDSMATECPALIYAPVGDDNTSLAQLKREAETRLAARGLQVRWAVPQTQPFGEGPGDRLRLRRLLATVLPALERYPAVLFERVQVTHVALVKNLRVAGQRRLAMPAPETDSVVYADNGYPVCPAGMEMRAHHELYHVIEHRLFKDFYYRDPSWLALNPPGMAYGQGGAAAYGTAFQNLGHPAAGLVSRYAAYGPEEDKAEVFGWMMTPGYAARVQRWAKEDAALEAKRRFMAALFAAQTGGAMDDNYFADRSQSPPAAAD